MSEGGGGTRTPRVSPRTARYQMLELNPEVVREIHMKGGSILKARLARDYPRGPERTREDPRLPEITREDPRGPKRTRDGHRETRDARETETWRAGYTGRATQGGLQRAGYSLQASAREERGAARARGREAPA